MSIFNNKFGVEIEFKGISNNKAAQILNLVNVDTMVQNYNHRANNKWKIVTDSSVSVGYELVSPVLQGEDGLKEAMRAITALDDAGAHVDRQCGVHVHFDASDLTASDVKSLVRRYAQFEHEIDSFMPESRRANNNTYTKSLCDVITRRGFTDANNINEIGSAMGGRYFKINVESYRRHGTIEFRQHSGTLSALKLSNWVRFLADFIKASQSQPEPQAVDSSILDALPLNHKQRIILNMVCQSDGATINQLAEATGLQHNVIRRHISVTLRRDNQLTISTIRARGGNTRFILESAPGTTNDDLWRGISEQVAEFYRNRSIVLQAA